MEQLSSKPFKIWIAKLLSSPDRSSQEVSSDGSAVILVSSLIDNDIEDSRVDWIPHSIYLVIFYYIHAFGTRPYTISCK